MEYNISIFVKKVMIMDYQQRIEKLIEKHNGTLLSSDIDRYQIPRIYLTMMVAEGKLERVNRGVYVSVDHVEDEMYAMQTKYPKLIYSHETALFMHGLSDRTPFEYSATVQSGYKVVTNIAERFKIFYIKNELHELGVENVYSPFGNIIRVYSIERTICDILRSRNRIDIQIINKALKQFVKLNTVDYTLLMEYAKKMKVNNVVKNYLEVLL